MENENLKWKSYNEQSVGKPVCPRLLNTLESFFTDKSGLALDLGCGGGRDTVELLRRGWKVCAVDMDKESLLLTEKNCSQWISYLEIVHARFEDLELEKNKYDLINASFSIPFCRPTHFKKFWSQIIDSLTPNGILSCELFGINDTWANKPGTKEKLTFFEKSEIEKLISDLKVEFFKEEETDARAFSGGIKHWHTFLLVCQKGPG